MNEPTEREDAGARGSAEAELVETDAVSDGQAMPVGSEIAELSPADAPERNSDDGEPVQARHRVNWSPLLTYGVLPGLALLLAMAAGFVKWQASSAHTSEIARGESVAAAKESTIALLSYTPDTVEKVAAAAEDRLTGKFKDAYAKLTRDLVIPGAKQKQVSVSVGVPDGASVSATPVHAVALLFVNQSAVVGSEPPINTESSIRVTLEKRAGRWLISGFDPI